MIPMVLRDVCRSSQNPFICEMELLHTSVPLIQLCMKLVPYMFRANSSQLCSTTVNWGVCSKNNRFHNNFEKSNPCYTP